MEIEQVPKCPAPHTQVPAVPPQPADLDEPAAQKLHMQLRAAATHIERSVEAFAQMVAAAHQGRIWLALGYSSWREYTEAELNLSGRHTYRLLEYAEVCTGIRETLTELGVPAPFECSPPESNEARPVGHTLPERALRGLKPQLPEVRAELAERVTAAEAAGEDLSNPQAVITHVTDSIAAVREAQEQPEPEELAGDKPDVSAEETAAVVLPSEPRYPRNENAKLLYSLSKIRDHLYGTVERAKKGGFDLKEPTFLTTVASDVELIAQFAAGVPRALRGEQVDQLASVRQLKVVAS